LFPHSPVLEHFQDRRFLHKLAQIEAKLQGEEKR